jgi:acetylornithine deacetylase
MHALSTDPIAASAVIAPAGAASLLLERLVAIPSVTGGEEELVSSVEARLSGAGWRCESIAVAPGRRNLFARRGPPRVVFSTHADTVPPFFPPRRERDALIARGACDAKGSLAAMIVALEALAGETSEVGLLLVVGEERGSDGAIAANLHAAASSVRYLVGGEPTDNRFVAGSKGCVRVTIETRGVAGHSSISGPEGARSAVDPLLDVLGEIRGLRFPVDPEFGPTTANIGILEAGTAPNVVAERGRAEVLFRTGLATEEVLGHVRRVAQGRAEVSVPYRSEPIAFRVPRGRAAEAAVVSYACDLPLLDRWGEPLLVGPGSIEHAHAADERVELAQVEEAALLYADLARGLLARGEEALERRR